MKNTSSNKLAFLTIAALAAAPSAQPESDIAIPVGKAEISQGVPDLGQNEKENWQRLREERKLARQQILSDIKASAKDEIKNVQEERLQQKANNNINENKEKPLNKGLLHPKEKESKGIGNSPGFIDKPKPGFFPHETPKPIEHITFPKI